MPPAGLTPHILVINPNTSLSVSATILELVTDQLAGRGEADLVTAPFGFAYISTHVGVALAAHAVLEVYADYVARAGEPDAIIVACFGDPAVEALREITAVPVVGFAEAGLLSAAREPGSFLVATTGAMWLDVLKQLAFRLTLLDRVAGFVSIQAESPAEAARQLSAAAAASGAARIVLGGAGLIPSLPAIGALTALPVVDPHRSAVERALALAGHPRAVPQTRFTSVNGLSSNLTRLLGPAAGAIPPA
jgi:allantoin racemase